MIKNEPWFYVGDLNAQRHQKPLKIIEKSGFAFFAFDSAKYVYAPEGSLITISQKKLERIRLII